MLGLVRTECGQSLPVRSVSLLQQLPKSLGYGHQRVKGEQVSNKVIVFDKLPLLVANIFEQSRRRHRSAPTFKGRAGHAVGKLARCIHRQRFQFIQIKATDKIYRSKDVFPTSAWKDSPKKCR